jgi:hypothetical protein
VLKGSSKEIPMNTTKMNKCLLLGASLAASIVTASAATANEAAATTSDATASAPAASAETTHKPVSMALLAGHGFKDAFQTGFGARVGYTLESKIHVGASFLYHVGTQQGPVQSNAWYGGGEVGYELGAGPMIIRPYVGFGTVSVSAKVTLPAIGDFPGTTATASENRFAFWPGAAFLFPFEDGSAFIGADAKFVVVENASALNTYGTFGLAF